MTQSRRHVERVLTNSMDRRGWKLLSQGERFVFGPGDPALGGTTEVLVKKLHRQVRLATALEAARYIEESVEAAVEDAKKRADMLWEEAAEVVRFVLGTMEFCSGIVLPLPDGPSSLFRLVPVVMVGQLTRAISAREFASWDVPEKELLDVSTANMLDTPLPAQEIYSHGARAVDGMIDLIPASGWLGTIPRLGDTLGIGQDLLVCVPRADRLHLLPIAGEIEENALNWFRQFNLHHHDQAWPFRLYEVRGGVWNALSADIGDSLRSLDPIGNTT